MRKVTYPWQALGFSVFSVAFAFVALKMYENAVLMHVASTKRHILYLCYGTSAAALVCALLVIFCIWVKPQEE